MFFKKKSIVSDLSVYLSLFLVNCVILVVVFSFIRFLLFPFFLNSFFSTWFWSIFTMFAEYCFSYGLDRLFPTNSPEIDTEFFEDLVLEIESSELFKVYNNEPFSIFFYQKPIVGFFAFVVVICVFFSIFFWLFGNQSVFTYLENSLVKYYVGLSSSFFLANLVVLQLSDFYLSPLILEFSVLKGDLLYNLDILGDGFDVYLGNGSVERPFLFYNSILLAFMASMLTFPLIIKIFFLFFPQKLSISDMIDSFFRQGLVSLLITFLLSWSEFNFFVLETRPFTFIILVNAFLFVAVFFKTFYIYFLYFIMFFFNRILNYGHKLL